MSNAVVVGEKIKNGQGISYKFSYSYLINFKPNRYYESSITSFNVEFPKFQDANAASYDLAEFFNWVVERKGRFFLLASGLELLR